jgi:hypothetical protein
MKKQILAFQARMRMITSFLNGLDINRGTIDEYKDIGNKGMDLYQGFHKKIQDNEEFKKLSPIEQQTLMANRRNYSEFLTNLHQELQYLTSTRQPLGVQDCSAHATSVNMLLDKLVDVMGGDDGTLKYPRLKYVREKGWGKIKYKDQIYNLATELDLMIQDYGAWVDESVCDQPTTRILVNAIYVDLVQALSWLDSEHNRVEKEGMPETKELKLPTVEEPKVPEENKTNDKPEEHDEQE